MRITADRLLRMYSGVGILLLSFSPSRVCMELTGWLHLSTEVSQMSLFLVIYLRVTGLLCTCPAPQVSYSPSNKSATVPERT